jgi:hypothetical protein
LPQSGILALCQSSIVIIFAPYDYTELYHLEQKS